ncbi:hypothetical protein [Arenimonas sp.]|uniref:hypothetical protein n=1 Tax=Arenimonas sp. TaxID=1872635 RepID=UPI0039E60CED
MQSLVSHALMPAAFGRSLPMLGKRLLLAISLLFALILASPAFARGDVWVNTSSGVYHCPGGQYYGNTKRGKYLSEREAVVSGYRAAYGKTCSPQAAQQGRSESRQSLTSSPSGATAQVWVNTSSHVYHCPGTRYYGATKRGRYMAESDAIASGNRPAYGARC